MTFLMTITIGGIIGWLASIVMKTNVQMGILGNVVVGIIGSLLGGVFAGAAGIRVHVAPASWIFAILGAALVILTLKGLGIFMSQRPVWRWR